MIRYQVRSKELVDILTELKSERLIKSPYFQRNLVWRLIHKVDFIRTILMGLPFPQIFIAKGEIDVDTMITYSCVVDGQQRLTAIQQYVANEFDVDGKIFKDLDGDAKESFLKYQVPVIDLDVKQKDPVLKEIFKRLNRTFYALSNIEKQSTEFAASDLMLISKVLTDELFFDRDKSDDDDTGRDLDPLISSNVVKKVKKLNFSIFQDLILNSGAFSNHEIARKVHLSFVLNVIATCVSGWYNRNSGVSRLLESEEPGFDKYIEIATQLNLVAEFVSKMRIKSTSYWMNKANLFTLIVVLFNRKDELANQRPSVTHEKLKVFERDLPQEYSVSAKEAVNNKRERMLRNKHIDCILFGADD